MNDEKTPDTYPASRLNAGLCVLSTEHKMDLILPLKREYFEQIKAGTKTEEYRLVNDYWRARLYLKKYERIVLTLGYPKSTDTERRLILSYKGYTIKQVTHPHFGTDPVHVFALDVTHNLELRGGAQLRRPA